MRRRRPRHRCRRHTPGRGKCQPYDDHQRLRRIHVADYADRTLNAT